MDPELFRSRTQISLIALDGWNQDLPLHTVHDRSQILGAMVCAECRGRGLPDIVGDQNGGDDAALNVCSFYMIDIEYIFNIDGILQLRLGPDCREALNEKAVFPLDTADHYICISDINC